MVKSGLVQRSMEITQRISLSFFGKSRGSFSTGSQKVPWPPSGWLQKPCLINFLVKVLRDSTQLYSGHALLVNAVEKAAVFSHALYLGTKNFAEPFLGAEDLTPRLYLVFCFWWVGQISWCLRRDLQCWRAAPRYCSQYFFSFSFESFM